MPKATTEEEQRLAEAAAKKSRLKQKLVKSARSVAIFSLKLKERRAREAERVAKEKAEELEHEKVCRTTATLINKFLIIFIIFVSPTRCSKAWGCREAEASLISSH